MKIKIDEVENKVSAKGNNYLSVKANGRWMIAFSDPRIYVGAEVEGSIEQAVKDGRPMLSKTGQPFYNLVLPKLPKAGAAPFTAPNPESSGETMKLLQEIAAGIKRIEFKLTPKIIPTQDNPFPGGDVIDCFPEEI